MKQAQQKNIHFVYPPRNKVGATLAIRKIWGWGCLGQQVYFVL